MFKPEETEEMILNPENYDAVFRRHAGRCFSTVDSDGKLVCGWFDVMVQSDFVSMYFYGPN